MEKLKKFPNIYMIYHTQYACYVININSAGERIRFLGKNCPTVIFKEFLRLPYNHQFKLQDNPKSSGFKYVAM